ncbi:MAG: LCP family protein, partial [Eggerthellaceae bacterium]|nr:LCP family protein [Eggerthellaceae bacterium]
YGPNKINAAFAFGGPALMVRTVSEFAGVPIDHYMQVDFDGFKEIVDALGGVEVDVPIDIDDAHTGKLSAGEQTLTGEQALILARSRHAYDNYGDGDGYRASNQRMILGAIAKKVLDSDAATMASTISSLSNYITTDLSVKDIMALVTSMSKLKSGNMLSASCPTGGYYLNETWYEICFLDEWQSIMGRVDAGLPPYEEEDKNKNIGGVVDVEEDLSGESFSNAQEDGYEATNENLSNSYNYDYDVSYDEAYY